MEEKRKTPEEEWPDRRDEGVGLDAFTSDDKGRRFWFGNFARLLKPVVRDRPADDGLSPETVTAEEWETFVFPRTDPEDHSDG